MLPEEILGIVLITGLLLYGGNKILAVHEFTPQRFSMSNFAPPIQDAYSYPIEDAERVSSLSDNESRNSFNGELPRATKINDAYVSIPYSMRAGKSKSKSKKKSNRKKI